MIAWCLNKATQDRHRVDAANESCDWLCIFSGFVATSFSLSHCVTIDYFSSMLSTQFSIRCVRYDLRRLQISLITAAMNGAV